MSLFHLVSLPPAFLSSHCTAILRTGAAAGRYREMSTICCLAGLCDGGSVGVIFQTLIFHHTALALLFCRFPVALLLSQTPLDTREIHQGRGRKHGEEVRPRILHEKGLLRHR